MLRSAKASDSEALAKLFKQLNNVTISADHVESNLGGLFKASAGMSVAEFGLLIGCVGWAVSPTVHRGLTGRITVLLVDEQFRRKGIGTRLLAEAEKSLAKKGCGLIEVVSDIDFKNSHGFFRSAKFTQASYRFTRKIAN